jgi:choline dehydrogenase-like flavoprotein
MRQVDTDIVIVGTGPGGATLARELARTGGSGRVLLLERGRDWRKHRLYGTYPGAILYTDKGSFLTTSEGLSIVRPMMLGGATSMYCACAADPLPWWQEQYGIDLAPYTAETRAELAIAPLPRGLRGEASTRIAAAAAEIGQEWIGQDKFMSPARSPKFDCRATCMLGCRCGAKWNAAEYVDEAIQAGCELWTGARVDKVMVEDCQATGVVGHIGRAPFSVSAKKVIISAGGIGSARLLQRSGLAGAGKGMAMDTTVIVYGHAPFRGNGNEPPMTWSYADDEIGVLFSTLIDPWLNYPLAMVRQGPAFALTWYHWARTFGIMIKLKDDISGGVPLGSRIHKGLTIADQKRLARAQAVAVQILRKAGCDPNTIFTSPLRGTHPSGTVRIGPMLTTDLETEVKNLYVCDASVFPQALARPTVLTIISLAKRLAKMLSRLEKQ